MADDHSDTASFHSADDGDTSSHLDSHALDPQQSDATAEEEEAHFSPEEEARLLAESAAHKKTGNAFFGGAAYTDAIGAYDKALAACPTYLDYETAVLRANVAACHVKLEEWKAAVDAASKALEGLDRLDGSVKGQGSDDKNDGQVQEVDDAMAARIERLEASGHGLGEVRKLRVKALLRRARAREGEGGWSSLAGADEDYRALNGMRGELAPLDRAAVDRALRALPPRLDEAKQREMGDMMDKLKGLGNGLLKPFGLSTDNFQFTKDENTGGYSMQFNQNGK